jgi:hypothetical protein
MYEIVLLDLTCLEGRPVNQDHTRSAQGFHLDKPPATPVNIYYVSQVRGSDMWRWLRLDSPFPSTATSALFDARSRAERASSERSSYRNSPFARCQAPRTFVADLMLGQGWAFERLHTEPGCHWRQPAEEFVAIRGCIPRSGPEPVSTVRVSCCERLRVNAESALLRPSPPCSRPAASELRSAA